MSCCHQAGDIGRLLGDLWLALVQREYRSGAAKHVVAAGTQSRRRGEMGTIHHSVKSDSVKQVTYNYSGF